MAKKPDLGQDLGAITHNRNFMLLWVAQIVSQLSFNMLNFVLIAKVFLTTSSSLAVSGLILAIGVPALVFGLFAGVYVDRWNKKWVLVATNAIRALAVLGYLFYSDSLIWLYLVTFLVASVTQFFAPAEAATIPSLVSPKRLISANSLFLFTLYGSFIAGYSIAGPIQHLFGEDAPIWIAAAAYAVATLLTLFLPSLPAKKVHRLFFGVSRQVRGLRHELFEGLREIRGDVRISRPILFLTLSQTIIGVIITLMPAFSEEVLRISVRDASYILVAPAGAGMVLGAVLMGRLSRRFNPFRLVGSGVALAGVALVLAALSRGGQRLFQAELAEPHSHLITQGFLSLERIFSLLIAVGVAIFLLGVASSIVTITAQTLLQRHTPERIRGRVFATLNVLVNVAATIPLLAAGALADSTSVVFVFLAIGFLVSFWGLYELWRSRLLGLAPERRRLPRPGR
jgi:MFS family permease